MASDSWSGIACRRADRPTEHMGAGTIQTAARAARIGMKFFITAIGAAQFLNAARHSFLFPLACASADPSVTVLRTMPNAFHPADSLHNIGGDIDATRMAASASHRDFASELVRSSLANELLEFVSMNSSKCTKPGYQVLLEYRDNAHRRSPNRILLVMPSRRQR